MIVKTLQERNGTALVEWIEDGQTQRALVPTSELSEDGDCAHPERGLPYGVNFADLIHIAVQPTDIDRELKNAGVWTVDDLLSKPKLVQGAIIQAYGAVLKDLLRNARAQQRR